MKGQGKSRTLTITHQIHSERPHSPLLHSLLERHVFSYHDLLTSTVKLPAWRLRAESCLRNVRRQAGRQADLKRFAALRWRLSRGIVVAGGFLRSGCSVII
ncbi:hypothetical protein BAUCODRAFT_281087 [Baudoinia panamericana UAMH 10762]|uniref:Uncharacterized protein n=1 Tax=Baudoinia panamericana (strain UAMH 10762) TaxID=717646 RepID=M2MLC4_BAUPA|nr:uncharacterized protein BAUCODRAFT_281087 [Baudoinia panamericana UAMH 10762]EMC92183.1 hypothetical protein BAUCODRAFT_281087 [Baudoinia panamericana UAMH 10762]